MKKIFILILCLLSFSFSALCQYDDNRKEDDRKDYLHLASQELDSNNYKKVIDIVNQAIEKGNGSSKLIQKRAIAYYKIRDTKKAFNDIDQIVLEKEKDYLLYPILSVYYLSRQENLDAINSLVVGYRQNNKDFLSSSKLLNSSDVKKVIELIDKELQDKEPLKELYAIKSIINFSQNNLNDSYSDLTTALENENENGFLYYLLGEIKLKRKEYISAVSSYNTSIHYGYEDIEVYKQRAVGKGFINDFSGAIEDYNIVLKNQPENYEVYYLRSIAKNYLRDYSGALSDLNRSIKLNDKFASAYNYRGIIYINVGDYASALMDFYKTLSLEPNHPFTHNNIGLAQIHSGQSTKAEKYFTKAIELDPEHADAYYNRGKLRLNNKDLSGAKSDLLKSINLNYQNPDAHYQLALTYLQEKNKEKNKKLEEKICSELEVASKMNHPEATKLLNEICHKEEEPVE